MAYKIFLSFKDLMVIGVSRRNNNRSKYIDRHLDEVLCKDSASSRN